MIAFLPFALVAAAWLSGLVVIATWDFRTSTAPLAVKLTLPALMLVASLDLPWHFVAMLGRPVPIAASDLPNGAHLLALQMFDGDTRAQIWVNEGVSTRLYEITVTDADKQQLRKARAGVAGGDGVTIRTDGGQGKPTGMYANGSGGFGVEIKPRAPEKTGE